MGPHPPRLTMAAQYSWKNTGMLAGVTDCRRSLKWGCRGRLVLGFKLRWDRHTWERTTWSWRRGERTTQFWGEEKVERTTLLWQSGDPVAATELMVPGA